MSGHTRGHLSVDLHHLLLVVALFTRDLLALRIRCVDCDGARLAISRNDDPASQRRLTVFLVG